MDLGDRSVYAMSITPFDASGELDEGLLRSHLRYLSEGGNGIFVCSQGSGEGDLLTFDEKVRICEIAVDEVGSQTAVCAAGIGLSGSTAQIAALAARIQETGVDAIYVLPPRPGPLAMRADEIEAYYRAVLDVIDCPAIIASNLFLSGYPIPFEVIDRLVTEFPSVRAVLLTDTSGGGIAALAKAVEVLAGRAQVWTALALHAPAAHAAGIDALLCMEPNVENDIGTKLWAALDAGDPAQIRLRFQRLTQLNSPIARYGNPRSLKEALSLLGRDGGKLREPYRALPPEARADMAEEFRAMGLTITTEAPLNGVQP